MLGKMYEAEVCSIARALEVVGERWSLLILRNALFAGSTRYGEFQRSLGIATNVLQDRLDRFIAAGLMERRPSSGQPELHEYVLTEKGRAFQPVLLALTEWGDRWSAPEGPPVLYRHRACGSPVSVDVTCETCGTIPDTAVVRALPGQGMPADRAERMLQRIALEDARATTGTAATPR
jgi:DNA-binding HxlR family transcriptional regulator